MKKLILLLCSTLLLLSFYQPLLAQNGNVGIGTNNPQAKLHVNGNTQIDSKLEIKNSAGETIFQLDPENKSFEFLDTDGSVFYRLAIEEVANFTGEDGNAGQRNPPGDPTITVATDSSTGNVTTTTRTDDGNVQTIKRVEVQPNGITTTTIDRGNDVPSITIIENPIAGSIIESLLTFDDFTLGSKEIERFTDATGTTISVFENNMLVSRKVFDKDGNKVIDVDGNGNTATSIGMETTTPDGIDFFVDRFGISKFDADFNFTGLGFNPVTGVINEGNLNVTGLLQKSGGSFKIDHPLDPTNKWLYHSFVESPDMMNIYNGNITTDAGGEAVVELPSYFGALNDDFRYQLTTIGTFSQAIILEEIHDGHFKIKTDQPNVKVSWQVTGIRKDDFAKDNRIEVEVEKTGWDKGKRLYDPNRTEPYTEGLQRHWQKAKENWATTKQRE